MKKPKKEEKIPGYVWYCAYAECMDKEYILKGQLYDLLNCEESRESAYYGGKFYKTETEALHALVRAVDDLYFNIYYSLFCFNKEKLLKLKSDIDNVLVKKID